MAERDWEDQAERQLAVIDKEPPALIVISSDADLLVASEALKEITDKRRHLDEERKSITRPIDQAKANVVAKFKPYLDELELRENALRGAITKYQQVVAARQKEEEARLRDEQAKLQADAEKRALKLLGDGKENQAVAVMQSVPPVPTVVMATPATPGIFARQNWKFKVEDMGELMIWAVETNNLEYIVPNEKLLGEIARSSKGRTKIPGVKFFAEDGLTVRR